MSIQIESGTGNGKSVGVSEEYRLMVDAVSQSIEHHTNFHEGLAFHINFSQQSAASSDQCIFYMKNINSSDKKLIVEGVTLYVSKACEVYFKLNDAGTPGGSPTEITPVNLNASSGKPSLTTVYKDDGMTGLSGGLEFSRYKFIGETASTHFNFEQDVVLDTNNTMTMYVSNASTNVFATIPFSFHNGV